MDRTERERTRIIMAKHINDFTKEELRVLLSESKKDFADVLARIFEERIQVLKDNNIHEDTVNFFITYSILSSELIAQKLNKLLCFYDDMCSKEDNKMLQSTVLNAIKDVEIVLKKVRTKNF